MTLEGNYEVRLANIRKSLSTQDDRLEKLRAERIQNKPLVGYDATVEAVLKALAAADAEARRSAIKVGPKITEAQLEDSGIV